MYLRADPPYAALASIIEKSGDQPTSDTLTSPLRRDEQCHNIHGFAAEFSAPFVRSIRITAQRSFAFAHNNPAEISGIHNVLKNTASIFSGSLRSNVR